MLRLFANRYVRTAVLGGAGLLVSGSYLYAAKKCNISLPACPNGGTWSCVCNADGSSVCTGGCN
jgi:hypothetical protein